MFDDSSELRDVVLVTGANEFVAQHILKLLHEQDEHVDEIRVFDRTAYENKLGAF
jgi:nucleoside-diphosphate-sugar epimerase